MIAESDRTRSLANAALGILLSQAPVDPDRVAIIGYCFGGTVGLELGRTGANVRAIVGFHPGLHNTRPTDSNNITGKVLMCLGDVDPITDIAQRHAFEAEMRATEVDWQIHLYAGVEHSFTHPYADFAGIPGVKYDADADRRSWQAMLGLFAETID